MKITLKNGAAINCILNGNNYITQEDVSGIDFGSANLKTMSIKDDEGQTTTYTNMKLTNQWTQADGVHLIFHPRTVEEMAEERIQAKLDYIAMMTEVDLDE